MRCVGQTFVMGEAPKDLLYKPDLISEPAEGALLAEFDGLAFEEIRMHGVVAKRTAKHYGFDYDYERRQALVDAEPVPDWLEPVREKAAALAGVEPSELVEALVQRYPEGAQIGWHRDAPMFGTVVGVSLLAPARLRFRRGAAGARETAEIEPEPRSGHVLAGEARPKWQYPVPP